MSYYPDSSSHPGWVYLLLAEQRKTQRQQQEILKGIVTIMALAQVDQAALDTLATNLSTAITAVATEIQSLEAQVAAGQLPPASLDGLNAALSSLQALEVPAPADNGGGDTPAPATS